MKRFIRTSVAAAAATSLLISATPAMAQESSTAASLSKETTTSTATTSEHKSEEPTTEKDKEKGSGFNRPLPGRQRSFERKEDQGMAGIDQHHLQDPHQRFQYHQQILKIG